MAGRQVNEFSVDTLRNPCLVHGNDGVPCGKQASISMTVDLTPIAMWPDVKGKPHVHATVNVCGQCHERIIAATTKTGYSRRQTQPYIGESEVSYSRRMDRLAKGEDGE